MLLLGGGCFQAPSADRARRCMCVQVCTEPVYPLTSPCTPPCVAPWTHVSEGKQEPRAMPLTLSQRVVPAFSCSPATSPFSAEKPGSHLPPSICFILRFCICFFFLILFLFSPSTVQTPQGQGLELFVFSALTPSPNSSRMSLRKTV